MSELSLPEVPQIVDVSGRPILRAGFRSLFQVDDVKRRIAKIQGGDFSSLGHLYEYMLEVGPPKYDVKPTKMPQIEALLLKSPNFQEVVLEIKRRLALVLDSSDPLELDPILLLGPPGVGKTHFGQSFANIIGTGYGFTSMSTTTAGWVLSGASSQWRGARPGKVFETLMYGDFINPVMMIDEIDKARGEHAYDPLGSLYTLLEHETAKKFIDEYVEVPIDASRIFWFMTANDEKNIPSPIVNRAMVFEIGLTTDQARIIGYSLYKKLTSHYDWGKRFDPEPGDDILDVVSHIVPRAMRRAYMTAFGNAKLNGRSTILPKDFPKESRGKVPLGFRS